MADHRFPLQMEALALAIQSAERPRWVDDSEVNAMVTKAILTRASAFLGWVQATTPSHREANPNLRPPRRIVEALGEPIEGPAR